MPSAGPWTPDKWVRVFLTRVEKKRDGCWQWTGQQAGRKDTGGQYGFVHKEGRMQYAHRAYWEFDRGPVPDGLDLDHLCRNRLCVNPDHLEPVTRQENVQRGWLTRYRPSACKHGHPFDEANTYHYNGTRTCRACHAARERVRQATNRATARLVKVGQ